MRAPVSERSRHKFRVWATSSGDDVWTDIPSSLMSRISLKSGAAAEAVAEEDPFNSA
jgi:hypothetical protein